MVSPLALEKTSVQGEERPEDAVGAGARRVNSALKGLGRLDVRKGLMV